MPASRRPLGAGIVTLIVVDAVLVLVFLALLLQAVQSGILALPGAGAAEQGTAAAAPDDRSGADPVDPVTFTLPSRNIACEVTADAATCTIAQFSYPEPTVPGCDGLVGHDIRLTADGASWLCRDGGAPGRAGSDVPVLDYGETTSVPPYTCASAPTGVSCRNVETGRSFSLARAGATLD